MPQPIISAERPPVPLIEATKRKYLKSVLCKEEFDLFLLTWRQWFEGHSDFTQPEDLADVHTLCMEEVIQFRLQVLGQRFPNRDYTNAYNQSFRRAQQARENLAAHRTDRMSPSGHCGRGGVHIGNMNVAVMSGSVDEKRMLELQRDAERQIEGDLAALDKTRDRLPVDVIDAEFVPAGKGQGVGHGTKDDPHREMGRGEASPG